VTVNDGGSPNQSGTVVVNVNIGAVNDPPVPLNIGAVNDPPVPSASPNPLEATEDGPAVGFTVSANDPDAGDSHSCVVTTQPAGGLGTASFTGTDCSTGSFVPGAAGSGSFVVTVTDDGSPAESGTVSVSVTVNVV
jgi:hypothetical protein